MNNVKEEAESSKDSLRAETSIKREKKKKKKKRNRSSSKEHKAADNDRPRKNKKKSKVKDEDTVENSPDPLPEPALEGSMIGDNMVLIDRNNGKVYSATDRLENGKLKDIGILSKSGSIELHKSENEAEKPDFPFATDADDHCESPLQAYQDIVPFLKDFAAKTKSQDELLIYDPYYCDGTVVNNLKSLGFPNVYNRKEDCYQVWGTSSYPAHNLLVTNPPYSGDHIERLIDHVTSKSFGNRPWMLLLPQWVHKKDYYLSKTKGIRPFYIVPRKRYVYIPPPSFRESKKSDVHKKSSPFISMWYIWGGTSEQNERWLSTISRRIANCDVARSKSALRDLRRKGGQNKK